MRSGYTAGWLFLFFTALISLTCPGWAAGQHRYNVARAPVARALAEFARQSDISVIRPHLSGRDGKANAVRGAFTLAEGLTRLLKGTGFSFRILSPAAVKIMRIPPPSLTAEVSRKPVNFLPPMMEEIKVSATRRTDFADKLPYAISVTSGTTLKRLYGGLDNNAIFGMIGLSATNQGDSRDKLIIRGLSDGPFSGRTQALVSTYLDNARMNYNAPEPGLKLVDISSIEVLRGPQGTLYGSGSMGGIYRLVTNKPQFNQYHGKASSTYKITEDGSASREYSAMLNIPLIKDRMAMRGVAYYEKAGGYIDDIRLHLNNVNSSKLYGGRLSVSLDLRTWLHLAAGFNFQHLKAADTNYYNGALAALKRNNYTQEPRADILKQPYLTLEADLSWADLVSNIFWLDRDLDNYYDGSFAVPKLSALALTPSTFEDDRHIKTISSETHLNSQSGDHFEWLAGLFLSHRSEKEVTNLITRPVSALANGYNPADLLFTEKLAENLDEIALFGEVTYYVTERLAVTGGLRWFHYANSALSMLNDIGSGAAVRARGEQQKNGLVPKFTLSYFASDTRLYYLQVAEGYRLGGINLKGPTEPGPPQEGDEKSGDLTTFNSDRLLSIELGFKDRLFDGKLHFTGAVFFTDWRNIQSDQFDAAGLPIIGNIGNGQVAGAEIEMALRPLPPVQLHVTATWNSSDLTKITPLFGKSVGAVRDGSLPGAPPFTLTFSAQYQFDPGYDMKGMFALNYSYIGAARLLFRAGTPRQSDAYHLGSARLEVNRGDWRLTLFADNLFNSTANSFAFGNPFSLNEIDQVTPLRPRSYGLRLGWSY